MFLEAKRGASKLKRTFLREAEEEEERDGRGRIFSSRRGNSLERGNVTSVLRQQSLFVSPV